MKIYKITIIGLLGVIVLLIVCLLQIDEHNREVAQRNISQSFVTDTSHVDTTDQMQQEDFPIPIGYSHSMYSEYTPQNKIERTLLSEIKEMEKATNNLNYDKIMALTNPDLFKYLKKEAPNKTDLEIKKLSKNFLKENLPSKMKSFLDCWPKATYVGGIVTDIKNKVKEGNRLLYQYEFHTILCSEEDSIVNIEPEYCVAVSFDNGNKWFISDASIEENYEILGISFSGEAIDKVLSK